MKKEINQFMKESKTLIKEYSNSDAIGDFKRIENEIANAIARLKKEVARLEDSLKIIQDAKKSAIPRR